MPLSYKLATLLNNKLHRVHQLTATKHNTTRVWLFYFLFRYFLTSIIYHLSYIQPIPALSVFLRPVGDLGGHPSEGWAVDLVVRGNRITCFCDR